LRSSKRDVIDLEGFENFTTLKLKVFYANLLLFAQGH
jgi:hypothetical protein